MLHGCVHVCCVVDLIFIVVWSSVLVSMFVVLIFMLFHVCLESLVFILWFGVIWRQSFACFSVEVVVLCFVSRLQIELLIFVFFSRFSRTTYRAQACPWDLTQRAHGQACTCELLHEGLPWGASSPISGAATFSLSSPILLILVSTSILHCFSSFFSSFYSIFLTLNSSPTSSNLILVVYW